MSSLEGYAPRAADFASAWSQRFETLVREAAGQDDHLSRAEARSIDEYVSGDRLWSDNALNFLKATGQKVAPVDQVLQAGTRYVKRNATRLAGENGRMSYAEGRRLPKDLRADFAFLRGKKKFPDQPSPVELRSIVTERVLDVLDRKKAKRLKRAPRFMLARKPVVEEIIHEGSSTRSVAYLAQGNIYVARRKMKAGSPIKWYSIGPAMR